MTDAVCSAAGAWRGGEVGISGGELRLQLSRAALPVDLERLVAIRTMDLHLHAAERQRVGPVHADMMLMVDDGENALGQQAAAEEVRFPWLGERGDSDQHECPRDEAASGQAMGRGDYRQMRNSQTLARAVVFRSLAMFRRRLKSQA